MKLKLESEHLSLRYITDDDLENLYHLHSNPDVMRYIRPPATSHEEIIGQINKIISYYTENPGLGVFAANEKASGEFIGWFCLKHLDRSDEIEVGYRLLPEFWGRGYATEMTKVLVAYGFNHLGLDKITGITHPGNSASQKVLEKARLMYQKDANYYDSDVWYYALTCIAFHTIIRPETKDDYQDISEINDSAFGQAAEGKLVVDLRNLEDFIPELSLVAEYKNQLIGHVLLTVNSIVNKQGISTSLTLAPVAVLPQFQKQCIGSKLITASLEEAKQLGFKAVNVLGHPWYYPRFGFKPASKWSISPPFQVADDVFMMLELEKGALDNVSGTVQYPQPFMDL